ncbi:MAG: Ig-like domain-containing protein [Ignavibacteria bacterium]|nr:Ig-like domain-containing protein [Ignavibacteria bacterium]
MGPPGEGVESLTDPAIKPRVIYTYPTINSIGPYANFSNRVSVRFNKLMDGPTMKRSVSIFSSLDDVHFDTNSVSNQSSENFSYGITTGAGGPIVIPLSQKGVASSRTPWKIGQMYTLRIDSMARDINGNLLDAPFIMTFKPEPYFRVTSISPPNGATRSSLSGSMYLYFNSTVDTSILSFIHVEPPLLGSWNYEPRFPYPDSTMLSFFYSNAGVDSTYTITVDAGGHDKFGNRLVGSFSSSFTTQSFALVGSSPLNGSNNVQLNTNISVGCSIPIDTGSVRNAFTVNPSLTGTFSLQDGSRGFSFKPTDGLIANTEYAVTIAQSLRSKSGDTLTSPYTFSFRTGPFQVLQTFPRDGSTISQPSFLRSIGITCNAFVDTGTIRSAFSIVPPVDGSIVAVDGASGFDFVPTAALSPEMTYTITLSTSLRSKRGDTLTSPYTFSFRTGPFQVLQTSPRNGSTNVQPVFLRSIDITCNASIDTGTIRSAFSIVPSVDGSIVAMDGGSWFDFVPTVAFSPGTTYTVTLSTSLRSKSGSSLSEPYTFTFSTAPFEIIRVQPQDGSTKQPLNTLLFILLNAPLDTSGIHQAFAITPAVEGNLETFQGNTLIRFEPLVEFAPSTTYTITVSTTLHALGGVPLAAPYTFSFRTDEFHLVISSPMNGSIGVSRTPTLYFGFNAVLDPNTIPSSFAIAPPVPGSLSYGDASTSFVFHPDSTLAPSTTYTVTIGQSLRSRGGATPTSPQVVTFTTGN